MGKRERRKGMIQEDIEINQVGYRDMAWFRWMLN